MNRRVRPSRAPAGCCITREPRPSECGNRYSVILVAFAFRYRRSNKDLATASIEALQIISPHIITEHYRGIQSLSYGSITRVVVGRRSRENTEEYGQSRPRRNRQPGEDGSPDQTVCRGNMCSPVQEKLRLTRECQGDNRRHCDGRRGEIRVGDVLVPVLIASSTQTVDTP